MKRLLRPALASAMLSLVATVPFFASNQGVDAADDIVIRVGGGEADIAVNSFGPKEATISVGSTVEFDWGTYAEPHTVTFGIPMGDPTVPTEGVLDGPVEFDGTGFVSSGLVGGPFGAGILSMTFTEAGTFEYFCVIHPPMTGSITVVEDEDDAETAAEIAERSDEEFDAQMSEVVALAAQLTAKPVAVANKPNGGKEYTVEVGLDTMDVTVNRYFPKTIAITTLDTIKWNAGTFTPHSITIGQLPPGDPFEAPVTVPANNVYTGTGIVHSGMIGKDLPDGTTFSLSFSQPGSYTYYCLLHSFLNQQGTVTVTQAATPTAVPTSPPAPTSVPSTVPKPPNTGEGMAQDEAGYGLLLFAAVALLGLGAAGMIFATRRS